MKINFRVCAAFCATLMILGISSVVLGKNASDHAGTVQAPRFEVDPMWPKPLPNHWVIGNTIGVSVDAQDHVWIIHRAGSLERRKSMRRRIRPRRNAALRRRLCWSSIRRAI